MRRLGGEQSELRKSCARGSIWWLHPDISEPVRWHHKQPKKTGERDFNREIERTGGRVLSNAPMAILNPAPSPKRTFSLGTRTSSNVIPRVSEALCPMFISFLPGVTPGVSLSTMKPVKALAGEHFGSGLVRAKTKYQLATPPFVIHIFWPLRMYSSPFFSALVLTPLTSEPVPGSVTQYA
jgi:hypothetical protein